MSSPFVSLYGALPPLLKGICTEWGITPCASGAGFLTEIWTSEDDRVNTLKAMLSKHPEAMRREKEERKQLVFKIRDTMDDLAEAAKKSVNLHDLLPWQNADYKPPNKRDTPTEP